LTITSVPTACIRGCAVVGRHLARCTCADSRHEHVEPRHEHAADEVCQDDTCRWCDECAGCQPRSVHTGLLCQACIGRVTRAVLDIGELAFWLRLNVPPGTRRTPGEVLRVTSAPLDVQAVDDADWLHGLTVHWLAVLDGKRPIGDVRGTALPPGSTGLPTAHVAAGMLARLDRFAARDWAGRWHDSLTHAHATISRRWPREDRAVKLPLPCPSCDRVMLYLHPPTTPGAEQLVLCHVESCGRLLVMDDYYLRVNQALAERRQGKVGVR
jgi:hypothetical protein